eukprot:GHVU01051177.1.p1 GENE.GHVU01051177.1~~GHVU01051177.1.p1  ORF type:complete len:101 (-),score=18.15 GHVU01051177.1:427-729(-)
MIPASKVRRATELKAPFLQCDKYFHTLTLTELHAIMPPDSSADFDIHLQRSLRDLSDLGSNIATDIFIVYSAANIPKSNKDKVVAPEQIANDLQQKGFKV